jgi:hypothetical protein
MTHTYTPIHLYTYTTRRRSARCSLSRSPAPCSGRPSSPPWSRYVIYFLVFVYLFLFLYFFVHIFLYLFLFFLYFLLPIRILHIRSIGGGVRDQLRDRTRHRVQVTIPCTMHIMYKYIWAYQPILIPHMYGIEYPMFYLIHDPSTLYDTHPMLYAGASSSASERRHPSSVCRLNNIC